MPKLIRIPTSYLNVIRDYAELMVVLGILMAFTLAVAAQYQVRGPSMEPTLSQDNRVVVNRIGSLQLGGFSLFGTGGFVFQGPERGDVIIFKPQTYGNDSVVKRVIGIPGDNIDISRLGIVTVNGQQEHFGGGYSAPKGYFRYPVMVPPGHYFVLGDNRGASLDSRDWGFLPTEDIVGKAWAVVWPFRDFAIY